MKAEVIKSDKVEEKNLQKKKDKLQIIKGMKAQLKKKQLNKMEENKIKREKGGKKAKQNKKGGKITKKKEGGKVTKVNEDGEVSHSHPVPQFYKVTAKVLQRFLNKEGSLKTLVFGRNKNHIRKGDIKRTFHLLCNIIENMKVIEKVLEETQILEKEPKFHKPLALLLATELLIGKRPLEGECKPFEVIRKYKDELIASYEPLSKEIALKENVRLRFVRVNTLLSSLDQIMTELKSEGWNFVEYKKSEISYAQFLTLVKSMEEKCFTNDYHMDDLLVFPPKTSFYQSKIYKDHHIILQDKASCLPVYVSDVPEGATVIDACSAPGNKTLQIASLVGKEGRITAVERDFKRFTKLKTTLRSHGAGFVTFVKKDFMELPEEVTNNAEYVFVDPSCSSSGTYLHQEDKSEEELKDLSDKQFSMLDKAMSLPRVKTVVYSTCSIHTVENEEVVSRILQKHKDTFEIKDITSKLNGWINFGSNEYAFKNSCVRTATEIDMCTGFFVAKFVKKHDAINGSCDKMSSKLNGDIKPISTKKRKLSENITDDEDSKTMEIKGTPTPLKKVKKQLGLTTPKSAKKLGTPAKTTDKNTPNKKKKGGKSPSSLKKNTGSPSPAKQETNATPVSKKTNGVKSPASLKKNKFASPSPAKQGGAVATPASKKKNNKNKKSPLVKKESN